MLVENVNKRFTTNNIAIRDKVFYYYHCILDLGFTLGFRFDNNYIYHCLNISSSTFTAQSINYIW